MGIINILLEVFCLLWPWPVNFMRYKTSQKLTKINRHFSSLQCQHERANQMMTLTIPFPAFIIQLVRRDYTQLVMLTETPQIRTTTISTFTAVSVVIVSRPCLGLHRLATTDKQVGFSCPGWEVGHCKITEINYFTMSLSDTHV